MFLICFYNFPGRHRNVFTQTLNIFALMTLKFDKVSEIKFLCRMLLILQVN